MLFSNKDQQQVIPYGTSHQEPEIRDIEQDVSGILKSQVTQTDRLSSPLSLHDRRSVFEVKVEDTHF